MILRRRSYSKSCDFSLKHPPIKSLGGSPTSKTHATPQYQIRASLGYDASGRAIDHPRGLTPPSRPLSAGCKIKRTNDSSIVSNFERCRN